MLLALQICVICENNSPRITRIARIFTDLDFLSGLIRMIRLIRIPIFAVAWLRYVHYRRVG